MKLLLALITLSVASMAMDQEYLNLNKNIQLKKQYSMGQYYDYFYFDPEYPGIASEKPIQKKDRCQLFIKSKYEYVLNGNYPIKEEYTSRPSIWTHKHTRSITAVNRVDRYANYHDFQIKINCERKRGKIRDRYFNEVFKGYISL